jgi:hypothetical protein
MHPIDVQGRNLLAAERVQLLGADAKPSLHTARHLRRRLGRLVIAAGLRLAREGLDPEVLPRVSRVSYRVSEAEDQAKGLIDCTELARIEVSG